MEPLQKTYLAETARWQKFLGVVMMVFTVLIALLGFFFIVAGSFLGNAMGDVLGDGLPGGIAGAAVGIVYILGAVLYYFFASYLLRSAKALKAYGASDNETDLTEGLKNNMSYFKLSGILLAVTLCIIAIAVVIAIIGAIVG